MFGRPLIGRALAGRGLGQGGKRGNGGAPSVGIAPIIGDQTLSFGRKTRAGAGGVSLVYTGGAPTSASIDSGTDADHWQVSAAGVFTPSATGISDGLSASYTLGVTYTNSAGEDSATLTINTIALGWSVASITELETAAEHASLAYGDTIYLRSGTYNSAQTDVRLRRAVAPSGTYTAPSELTPRHKGKDLTTGNPVVITKHAGATPVITRLAFDNTDGGSVGFRLTNLSFIRPKNGSQSNDAAMLSGVNGTTDIIVDNCYFECDLNHQPLDGHIYQAMTFGTTNATRLVVQDNTVSGVSKMLTHGAADDVCIVGNEATYIWEDFVKGAVGNRRRENWNVCHFKFATVVNPAIHGDYSQMVGGTAGADDLEWIGNQYWSEAAHFDHDPGGGGEHTSSDGQGFFWDNLSAGAAITNVRIWGNFYSGYFVRGITIEECVGATVYGNTIVSDFVAQVADTKITFRDCTNCSAKYNITPSFLDEGTTSGSVVSDNDISLTYNVASTFTDLFVNPQGGAALTDPEAMFTPKPGSAPLVAPIKYGCFGTYVDFDARTTSFPWDQQQFASFGSYVNDSGSSREFAAFGTYFNEAA